MNRFPTWIVLATAAALHIGAARGAETASAPVAPKWSAGFHAIAEDDARRWLEYLAGPECAGRGTGQPGYDVAARYVAEQFAAIGLRPGSGGSYLQQVPFLRFEPVAAETRLVLPGGFSALPGAAFGVSRATDDYRFEGPVVFLNAHGAQASLPEGLDLANKAVVVVRKETGRTFVRSLFRSEALMISITDGEVALEPRMRAKDRPGRRAAAPRFSLTRDAARAMANLLGVDPGLVDDPAAGDPAVRWQESAGSITLEVKVREEEVSIPNVVGILEGSDPAKRDEHIGVGAHLDHLGVRGGVVYPGADDDGSGVAAMLLVADALMTNEPRPARSVVFMAFCAEEIGLIGSRYYAENPWLPLDKMSCLLQMDMIGRNEASDDEAASDNVDSVHLVGAQRLENRLHDLLLEANQHTGLSFEYDEEDVFTRSDHANFARQGVPVCFFFAGFHPDYHRPTDTVDKINYDKILRVARLNYLMVQMVSELPGMLGRDEKREG